jgi:murein L,D-transpeptidase YafK
MMNPLIKKNYLIAALILICQMAKAQPIENSRWQSRAIVPINKIEDSLRKQFEKQKIAYPPVEMFLRSFKYEKQLEVWVKSSEKEGFKFLKTYKVCQQSGTTGPKRFEGDFQVPEGVYFINEFNPNSNYHLSLGLNYPNASDKILSDAKNPGSAIYIHGDCVSTGCLPITDAPMDELFFLANSVRTHGQEFIPVHIFPIKFNVASSRTYLETATKDNEKLKNFSQNLKQVYDFFEQKREVPVVLVNKDGKYILN